MEDARLSATKFYTVRPNQPISLEVEIGDDQVGGTAVQLNGVTVPVKPSGKTPIGSAGQNLQGSLLQVVTTVKDQNQNSNRTSVTHHFTGGAAPADFLFQISVDDEGGFARYFITYILL